MGTGPITKMVLPNGSRPVLGNLYDVPETGIDLPAPLAHSRYDFVLVLPRTHTRETLTRLMRKGIEKYFHVTRAVRSMEVTC